MRIIRAAGLLGVAALFLCASAAPAQQEIKPGADLALARGGDPGLEGPLGTGPTPELHQEAGPGGSPIPQAAGGETRAVGGQGREALAELDKLPQDQAGPAALPFKADLLAGARDYAGAAKLYRRYPRDKPGDLAASFRLAQVLSWSKDYPASLRQYRQILQARPDDVQVRRYYAFVLSWSGQFDEAARELARTLDQGWEPGKAHLAAPYLAAKRLGQPATVNTTTAKGEELAALLAGLPASGGTQ